MLIVQACEFIEDGDGQYRLHEPMRHLGRLENVVAVDCHVFSHHFQTLKEIADVLILPFFHSWEYFPLIERRRSQGKVTIFETNDFFLDLQAWNPIAVHWNDVDVEAEHLAYIERADAVQTSTQNLADYWRSSARDIAVFKNQLSILASAREESRAKFVLGWAGSQGHLADFLSICPVLEKWLERNVNVDLHVMSHLLAKDFIKIEPGRMRFSEAATLQEYYRFVSNFEVGLAPLLPTGYNRARSDVKFLEYAANSVVGIYADLDPYRNSVKHGETGFLYKSDEDLLKYLDLVYGDSALRNRIRNNAYEYVRQERRIESHIQERQVFYKKLLRSEQSHDWNPNTVPDVISDCNYHRINLNEEEIWLRNNISEAVSEQQISFLYKIVEKFPNFDLGRYVLGKKLNDQRKIKQSIEVLNCGLNQCTSCSNISELGRAFFLAGENQQARRYLEQSVHVNPMYVPGWRYLVNFMYAVTQSDQDLLLKQMEQCHPYSATLLLAAARVFKGDKALIHVERILSKLTNKLKPNQLRACKTQFVETLSSFMGSAYSLELRLRVFEFALRVFPDSLKLKHSYALILKEAGKFDQAISYLAEAERMYQAAQSVIEEYKGGNEIMLWQIASHLQSQQKA